MKTKLTDRKRKILRKIYGALSLTTALFVFQACYGSPRDMIPSTPQTPQAFIRGNVKSKTTNKPIFGIKVSVTYPNWFVYTDISGNFIIYPEEQASQYDVKFQDVDSTKNGYFISKDTVVKIVNDSAFINVFLNAK